jgi:type III secretion apparatus needle protein
VGQHPRQPVTGGDIMTLNIDQVFSKLGEATQGLEGKISDFMGEMDSANTADVMKLQHMMQKWTVATQVQSNTIKTIGEGLKSTVQNIR